MRRVPTKSKLVSLLLGLFILLPFLLAARHTYIQSFTDFFVVGSRNALDSVIIWSQQNFGSNNAGELWRLFPLGGFFYVCTNVLHLPGGITLLILLGSLHLLCYYFFVETAKLLHYDEPANPWAVRIAALFFTFNTYTLVQLSDSFLLVLPYLLLPLQAYLFLQATREQKFARYAVLLAVVNAAIFGVNLIFDVISVGFLIAYGLWQVCVTKSYQLRKLLAVLGVGLSLTLFLTFFWIVPQIYSSLIDTQTASYVLQSESFYNLDSSILHVLRGLGDWAFFGSNAGVPYFKFSTAYNNNFAVLAAGFVVPGLVLGNLYYHKKNGLKIGKASVFFYILLFIAIPLIGGTHSGWPTTGLMKWAFAHVPYFNAFRNTYKFAVLEMFALAVLLASGLTILFKRTNSQKIRLTIGVIAVIAIFCNAFPYFTGQIFDNQKQIDTIPAYWGQAASYVNTKLSAGSRLFILPNQYFEVFNWPSGLKGFPRNLEETLFDKPVVHNTCTGCGTPNTADILNYTYSNLADPRTYRLLGTLGISNVLQRNDYASAYYKVESPQQIKNDLSAATDVHKVQSFGKLDLYSIDKSEVNPLFYSPQTIAETGKVAEFNDALLQTPPASGHIGLALSRQIKNYTHIAALTNLFKRVFDIDETTVSGNTAKNKVLINNSGTYSLAPKNDNGAGNYKVSYAMNSSGATMSFQQVTDAISIDGKAQQANSEGNANTDVALGNYTSDIAVTIGKQAYLLKANSTGELGTLNLAAGKTSIKVYKVSAQNSPNLVTNGSFESGTWQNKALDCQANSSSANISMKRINDATDGSKALELTASEDTACTYSPPIPNFQPGLYLYSFNTKTIKGHNPAYCVWDGSGCITYSNVAASSSWQTTSNVSYLDSSASNFYLYLYAQKGNYPSTIDAYDNIQIRRLGTIISTATVDLGRTTISTPATYLARGTHTISNHFETAPDNLVDNGSFEFGPWQPGVTDCSRPGGSSTISMSVVNGGYSGSKALQLRSTGDNACTSSDTLQTFSADKNYRLSIAYKVLEGSAGRVCVWDGTTCLVSQPLTSNDSQWHTYQTIVQPADTSKILSVYVYADGNKGPITVDYDDVRVQEVENKFISTYVLKSSTDKVTQPLTVKNVREINESKYVLNVSNVAKAPLYFQETYHPGWKLYVVSQKSAAKQGVYDNLNSAYQVPDSEHFIANGFANGWYIDSDQIPSHLKSASGEYAMVAVYSPQNYVYIGLIVSGATLVGCVTYLGYGFVRRKRHTDDEGTYHDPTIAPKRVSMAQLKREMKLPPLRKRTKR